MDLIKIFTEKTKVSIIIILGIYLPGFLTIFFLKRDLFISLDLFKLSVLSLAVGFPTFIATAILISGEEIIFCRLMKCKVKEDMDEFIYAFICNLIIFTCTIIRIKYSKESGSDIVVVLLATFIMVNVIAVICVCIDRFKASNKQADTIYLIYDYGVDGKMKILKAFDDKAYAYKFVNNARKALYVMEVEKGTFN